MLVGPSGPGRRLGAPVACLLAAVLVLLVPLACSDGEGSGGTDRRVEIYGLVMDWLLERERFPADPGEEPDETPTVFVDHLNRSIDLDVQVGLVGRFEGEFELRFVDALSEAVDDSDPEAPVRNDGVLVGLGMIPEEPPYLVRAEVYRERGDLDAYRFELVPSGEDWVMRSEPERVAPEGFVPGE